MTDFYVSISPKEAVDLINRAIIDNSITGELIDEYVNDIGNGTTISVMVYEKHYLRAQNRLTLTVVIDNLRGATHVHLVGSGGGQLFKVDGGAADDFEVCAYAALIDYAVK